jgi:hypothetical protein
MSLKRIARLLRRGSAAGVVWAMIPLVMVSGAPTASCACVACLCGAACPLDGSSAAGQASSDRSTTPAHPAQNFCGCCKVSDSPNRSQSNLHPHGTGFSGQQSRCHAVIAVRSAVQPSATPSSDGQMPALVHPAIQLLGHSLQARHRPEELNTGPPIDLLVTLCHLVI